MSKHQSVRALVVTSLLVVAVVAIVGKDVEHFRVRDDCDPVTFNAVLDPNNEQDPRPCIESFDGGTTFEEFIEELTEDKEVGSWKFNPDRTRLDRGQGTLLESRAGEFHTFTRVAEFGGGIVGVLNDLGGFGETRPECGTENVLAPPSGTNVFVPAGAPGITGPVAGKPDLPKGKTKWQCCIHPWMRSEITVR